MKTRICILLAFVSLLSVPAAYGDGNMNDHRKGPRSNTITTVDYKDEVGCFSSVAIGTDGHAVVSYYDMTHGTLKVAKCKNASCDSSTITTVDNSYLVGFYTSIAIGTDGLPIISYYDGNMQNLKVAKCGNASCTSGNIITTVDASEGSGYYTSIAIGADGLPVIAYLNNNNKSLKVLKCGNAFCNANNSITTVDNSFDVGNYCSLVIGIDGLPVIAYHDLSNGWLKVAKCGNASCTGGNTFTNVDTGNNTGTYTSIDIGTDGLPVIAYVDRALGTLMVAKCGDASCSDGNAVTTVDDKEIEIRYSSLAIGADGLPVIAFHSHSSNYLKVAKCGNASCTAGNTVTIVDSEINADVGRNPSIAIGRDGLPFISYVDETNMDLKVIKCANQFCINNWGRR